jgi:hypothetical protein
MGLSARDTASSDRFGSGQRDAGSLRDGATDAAAVAHVTT